MKKRHVSAQTVFGEYGAIRISATVYANPDFDGWQQNQDEPPHIVEGFKAIDRDGLNITDDLCPLETQVLEEALCEKYVEEKAADMDYLIEEQIERGRQFAPLAYA